MRRCIICFILISVGFINAKAQDSVATKSNREAIIDSSVVTKSTVSKKRELKNDSLKIPFKPNPTKAVLYSLVPGMGQIYNKKYWKVPIIYGGFVGLTYLIAWNGKYYKGYSQAYKATMSDDPWSSSNEPLWAPYLPYGVTPQDVSPSDISFWQSSFKRKKDFYRRNRDLSIIGAVALYAASMIDAYVDAQLFDFDISPNLSLKIEPTIMSPSMTSRQTFGLQCSLTF